jgi:hypothetical protein
MKKNLARKLSLARETVLHLTDPSLVEIHGGTLTLEGGPSCYPECPRNSGQPNCALNGKDEIATRDRLA